MDYSTSSEILTAVHNRPATNWLQYSVWNSASRKFFNMLLKMPQNLLIKNNLATVQSQFIVWTRKHKKHSWALLLYNKNCLCNAIVKNLEQKL